MCESFCGIGSYGLFRSMTGVDGRPEVILEGAPHLEGPYTEIPFKYKPGNIEKASQFVGKQFASFLRVRFYIVYKCV